MTRRGFLNTLFRCFLFLFLWPWRALFPSLPLKKTGAATPSPPEYDLCIIGAGAAGIALAKEFAGRKERVCLIEGGGFEWEEKVQSLYQGENSGEPYFPLDVCRLRYFGGTTNQWGGVVRPMDTVDFKQREWVPFSGWPISKEDLSPYYERAYSLLKLEATHKDLSFWEKRISPPLPLAKSKILTSLWPGNAVRFGGVFRKELESARNLGLFLHTNLLAVETNEKATRVVRIQVGDLEGRRFSLRAKNFVLACGGIENARILLLNNLGNRHDQVGRFFMEHAMPRLGSLTLASDEIPMALYTGFHEKGVWMNGELSLAEEEQRSQKILNAGVSLLPGEREEQWQEGYLSSKRILKSLLRGEIPEHFWRDIQNVLQDIDGTLSGAYDRLAGEDQRRTRRFVLVGRGEQAPNPESRVVLSQTKDALGLRRARLHWQFSKLDKHSLLQTVSVLADEFSRTGLGKIKGEEWLLKGEEEWSISAAIGRCHHIGTTRMALNDKEGVVDKNCRVHGMDNLYVAGSSVFPTSGRATPTLTLLALALKLAEDLKRG